MHKTMALWLLFIGIIALSTTIVKAQPASTPQSQITLSIAKADIATLAHSNPGIILEVLNCPQDASRVRATVVDTGLVEGIGWTAYSLFVLWSFFNPMPSNPNSSEAAIHVLAGGVAIGGVVAAGIASVIENSARNAAAAEAQAVAGGNGQCK